MNAGMLTTSINLAIAGDSSFVSSFTLAANPSTHTQIQPLTHTHTRLSMAQSNALQEEAYFVAYAAGDGGRSSY